MKEQHCPKCKSKRLGKSIKLSASYGFPQKNKCLDCGFESHIYLEKEKKK